jgi:ribose transport system permease protein
LAIAVGAFLLIVLLLSGLTPGGLTYFDVSFLSAGGAAIALAAMGETIVILAGGFDLSAGAVVSLVNVVLATNMGESAGSQLFWTLAALSVGAATGAANGVLVAFLRLPPIVVTLATMFIIQGVTLLVLAQPGGAVPHDWSLLLTGDAVPGLLPAPILVVLGGLAVWALVRQTRFGTGIYAVGSDEEAARANGIPVAWVKLRTYTLAGIFYAAAGIFLTAQTGSGDPLIGKPMLLQVFAAVVLGGTVLGGGRGGCLGTVFGAYTLMLTVNVLLVLDVSAYYSTVAEAAVLLLAILGGSLTRGSTAAGYVRLVAQRFRAWRRGLSPTSLQGRLRQVELAGERSERRVDDELRGGALRRWFMRNEGTLRLVLPSYVLLVVVLLVTRAVFAEQLSGQHYLNSLLVLASFLVVLGLGQGAVILTGGLDLSVPWTIAFCGILLTGTVEGSNAVALWAVPMVLAAGLAIGLANGLGIAILGISPIVMTIAMNGILQGLALVYSNGTPHGWSAPALRWFMTGDVAGFAPVVYALVAFVIGGTLLLSRTAFGRRVYAVGNSIRVARLSGLNVGRTVIGVYLLSGFCSALVGIMLTGFNGQAFNGMGDSYLLPSIAVVVVGGTVITGGRGHFLGIVGGALLLTALGIALAGTTLPQAIRDITYGLVVLAAILALRERPA